MVPSSDHTLGQRFRGLQKFSVALPILVLGLTGCGGSLPISSGGAKGPVSGSAGGSTSASQSSDLERCDRSLGTIAVVEDQTSSWWGYYHSRHGQLGSTVPVLRMMIQQSNCFVVVERGGAMRNMQTERDLERSGELRAGSNFAPGQMVAADYTMNPSIQFTEDTGGIGAAIGGLTRTFGGPLSSVAGSVKQNDASTTLIMIDNRSGVQLAVAEGTARGFNVSGWGGAYGWATTGAAGAYTKTPEGKIIVAAFVNSYNQLVGAIRNYKAQTVEGGLGTGGTLGVQGGTTPAGRKVK